MPPLRVKVPPVNVPPPLTAEEIAKLKAKAAEVPKVPFLETLVVNDANRSELIAPDVPWTPEVGSYFAGVVKSGTRQAAWVSA